MHAAAGDPRGDMGDRHGSAAGGDGWLPSGLCSQFVCDIASFGAANRSDAARDHVHKALYKALRKAFDAENCPFVSCYHEDRGDGVLMVVPPDVNPALLLTSVALRLRGEVREHNDFSNESTRMVVRVAVNVGMADWNGLGVVGQAVNDAFRILNADPFKRVLALSGAELGLIVTDRVYQDVVRHGRGLLDRRDYRPFQVAVKELRETAWITLPGSGAPPEPPPDSGADGTMVPISGDIATPPTTVLDAAVPRAATGPAADMAELAELVGQNGFGGLRYPDGDVPPAVLFELADHALKIPQLSSDHERHEVVRALPQRIGGAISRSPVARTDVHAIIRTCLDYPGGLGYLLETLHGFAGDSLPLARFKRALFELLCKPE
jgi:hypothetical protein